MKSVVPGVSRIKLSLRWKAFFVMFLLLCTIHASFGLLVYRQALAQYREQEREQLVAFRAQLEEQLGHSTQMLGIIGAQIMSEVSLSESRQHPFDAAQLAPDVLAILSDLRIFDAQGRLVGGLEIEGAIHLPQASEQYLLNLARETHHPATIIYCTEECLQYIYEPVIDRSGTEVIVGLGQPVAETLREFARQAGANVALLSTSAQAPSVVQPDRTNDGLRIFGVTNAPRLLPWLHSAAPIVRRASENRPALISDDYGSALVLATSLKGAADVRALFILDETATLGRIHRGARSGLMYSAIGLTLSAAALWLFLTPLSRRLSRVTRALPLLAEQKFTEARKMLPKRRGSLRFADELDLLTQTTEWLSRRLQRLNAAEAASEAKSRFLAEMSHEVRTPLHGILGMLEVLEHSALDEGQRESLRMVLESAQSLLRIVDDTLDLARIEAGRIEIETAAFSISHVVEGCVETFATRARNKRVRLLNFVDPALPPLVMGDAMRLRQILSNLCNNAVKFTGSGRVAVCVTMVGKTSRDVEVSFSVRDTGIGIPLEAQKQLFEPFRQASASTAANYGGSGLGLSICHGLVKRMGGTMGFASEFGIGTEFWFSLKFPLSAEATARPVQTLEGVDVAVDIKAADERRWIVEYLQAARAQIKDGAKLRIVDDARNGLVIRQDSSIISLPHPQHRSALLRAVAQTAGLAVIASADTPAAARPRRSLRILAVDDHPTNQHVIQCQLNLLGHEADIAADGALALRKLETGPYDVVLTDLRMPVLDGYDLAREIRRREAAGELDKRIPILAMTAQVTRDEDKRCADAGMDGLLAKPASLDDLKRALLAWSDLPANVIDGLDSIKDADPDEVPLDRAFLADLVGDDTALAEELVKEFLRINAPLFVELVEHGSRTDFLRLAELTHRLLGSSRTAGAKPLARILTALEEAATQKQVLACQNLSQHAKAEFERINAYLLKDSDKSGEGDR